MRIFDGAFDKGPFEFYPNRLQNIGDQTVLHEHNHPHVALFFLGNDCRYEIFAIRSNGEEIRQEMDAYGFVYIAERIKHRIKLIAGSEGAFICMFSQFGPEGRISNPKGSPVDG